MAISLIVIFLYCYHGVTLILVSTGPRYPVILGAGFIQPSQRRRAGMVTD